MTVDQTETPDEFDDFDEEDFDDTFDDDFEEEAEDEYEFEEAHKEEIPGLPKSVMQEIRQEEEEAEGDIFGPEPEKKKK